MAIVSYISNSKLLALLQAVDPERALNVRVLGPTSLSLETDAFQPVAIIDLANETLQRVDSVAAASSVRQKKSRRRGEYHLTAFGDSSVYYSLKELLAAGLRTIERHRPGTLEKLSNIKTKTKRIVANNPELLFDSEGLSEKYAESLNAGWWFGTNNSAQETESWLRRACECAGIRWGSKDFSVQL